MRCPNCGYDGLTKRELEVEEMIVHGKMAKEIEHELGISRSTQDWHRRNIYHKRSVRSAVELTKQFFERKAVSTK